MGHFANDCGKAGNDKGKSKALISSNQDWMKSTESEDEEVNYAPMANAEGEVTPTESTTNKVHSKIFDIDTDNISELKSFLMSLHVSFKSLTLENNRLKTEIQTLENTRLKTETLNIKKKNDHVESELVLML